MVKILKLTKIFRKESFSKVLSLINASFKTFLKSVSMFIQYCNLFGFYVLMVY